VKNILCRYDCAIFTSNPFAKQTFFPGVSREDLEEELVGICAINALALRLVVGMGFERRFLRQRKARGVWAWLQRPEPLRHFSDLHRPYHEWREFIIIAADTTHRRESEEAHGYAKCGGHVRCPWCITVYRREVAAALAICSHLMTRYAATEIINRERHAVAEERVKAQLPKLQAMIDEDPETAKNIGVSMVEHMLGAIASRSRQVVERGAYQ
jgi:hypothetical protein